MKIVNNAILGRESHCQMIQADIRNNMLFIIGDDIKVLRRLIAVKAFILFHISIISYSFKFGGEIEVGIPYYESSDSLLVSILLSHNMRQWTH